MLSLKSDAQISDKQVVVFLDPRFWDRENTQVQEKDADIAELTEKLAALTLQVEHQAVKIEALERDNQQLMQVGVSKRVLAEYRKVLYSLTNSEIYYLSKEHEIQDLIDSIDLNALQTENDSLVQDLINRIKEKRIEYRQPSYWSEVTSSLLPWAAAGAMAYFVPALAGKAMEAVYVNGYEDYLPSVISSAVEASGDFGKFILKDAHKLKAMKWAMDTAESNESYVLAASYGVSNALIKGTSWSYDCAQTAFNTLRLNWHGRENTNLFQFLGEMDQATKKQKREQPLQFSRPKPQKVPAENSMALVPYPSHPLIQLKGF